MSTCFNLALESALPNASESTTPVFVVYAFDFLSFDVQKDYLSGDHSKKLKPRSVL